MELANKSFKNNATGEIVNIVESYQNVAITDKMVKMDAKILSDPRVYTEYIDPVSFFNNKDTYSLFVDKIRNVDSSKISDDDNVEGINESNISDVISTNNPYNFPLASQESAVIYSEPEDEIEELKRKYGAVSVDTTAIQKQNESFSRILDEEPEVKPVVNNKVETSSIQETYKNIIYQEDQVEPPIQRIEVVDPIILMFKNVKRSVDFSIELNIDNKIPRLDFIEMMEDSYEVSIIDYLAEEFTKNILSDPSSLKSKIVDKIKSIVYVKDKSEDKPDNKKVISETKKAQPTKSVLKKPVPPKTQIIQEGKDPSTVDSGKKEKPKPPQDRTCKEGSEPPKPKSNN